MLRGLATVTFYAADHEGAKRWYTDLFGIAPYFDQPGYFEFRIGDYAGEFGVIDARYAPPGSQDRPGGAVVFWHVDDVVADVARLVELGAAVWEPATVRGEGWLTASVLDPFGNILGVMTNPHYLRVLDDIRAAGWVGPKEDVD